MKNRLKFFALAFLLLFFFTLFSLAVKRGAFRSADFAFTVKLQEAIDTSPRLRLSRFVGEVMEGSTFFANPEVSIVAVLGITGFALYDRKRKKIRWTALFIPMLFFFLVMGEVYGKSIVHHPAPPFFMIKNPTTLFPKYYINEEFSYPSGHAARAVFIGLFIALLAMKQWNNLPARFAGVESRRAGKASAAMRKRRVIIIGLMGIYVGLVSISRIYLGHHWLSDIIGGWLLGGGIGLLTLSFHSIRTDG